MKTLPIIDLSRYDSKNALLREYLRQNSKKNNSIVLVTLPEKKQETIELTSEKEQAEILEKIKKLNK